MATSEASVRDQSGGLSASGVLHSIRSKAHLGFSLIEVMLAIGIVAFAFIAVLALVPAGLGVFHKSMNTSVGAQIAQKVINNVQQTDFSDVVSGATPFRLANPNVSGSFERWFDNEGNEVDEGAFGAVYVVNTRIDPSITLPQSSAQPRDNPHLARITVQVAANPGRQQLAFEASSPSLWSGAFADGDGSATVPIFTVSTLIGKNQ